ASRFGSARGILFAATLAWAEPLTTLARSARSCVSLVARCNGGYEDTPHLPPQLRKCSGAVRRVCFAPSGVPRAFVPTQVRTLGRGATVISKPSAIACGKAEWVLTG